MCVSLNYIKQATMALTCASDSGNTKCVYNFGGGVFWEDDTWKTEEMDE